MTDLRIDRRPLVPRPQPAPRARIELRETAEGWTLTVVVDERTAEAWQPGLATLDAFAAGDLELSVFPNLVPGVPFPVTTVDVRVE